jgi:glycerol-3-phosphate dehydrogenase
LIDLAIESAFGRAPTGRRGISMAVSREPGAPVAGTHPGAAAAGAGPDGVIACDLLVVGGGVNGAGIARDAAGRGLSVVVCEKDDLASHTSSASTKLIHGGLRYLEHYEFGLVRKALMEREVLLRNAPHIMRPLRFVLPHDPSMRPGWMMRMGLFLYDHLARRELLPGSEGIRLSSHPAGAPLKREFTRAFVYSDGWVDDARLVVLNAVDAAERGATVLPRTACERVRTDGAGWMAELRAADGTARRVRARALVNATGQWAAQFLQGAMQGTPAASRRTLRLVKGSHIVVPRMYDHDAAYILQSPDRRIVFAIPYEGDFTLIGTTDIELAGTPGAVRISPEEVTYLCRLINRYFEKPIDPGDVVWSYAGVRPLLDDEAGDPSAVTRDYSLELTTQGPPLLTVWGGKITTYRKLAEEAVDRLHPVLAPQVDRMGPAWTFQAPLPGGDFDALLGRRPAGSLGLEEMTALIRKRHPWLPPAVAARWARSYGTRFAAIVGDAASPAGLGAEVAPGLFEAELAYLRDREWARTAADVLWRRSKLGLHLDEAGRRAVAAWLGDTGAGEEEGVAPVATAAAPPGTGRA